ncbi:hypothetical protein CYMTET_6773 [Cymbomonas tetramitiformis]|uniref:Uncharacterized protein n=1 Tax=Cymbomonas tetramitiformis TaxID=36881 RepID=A0AAE0LHK3_9CHLO|nr:hypothetical protein CYMTET_12099 [Cymbomonas tetramitiformis]KAK3285631.1 hypothetical protein CYMTET_6773 [Cymbomonas tetramitiformis]
MLTNTWTEAREAMENAMSTVNTSKEKAAAMLKGNLTTPTDGPGKTRLLGVAFLAYLHECEKRNLFEPGALWNALIKSLGENIPRGTLQSNTSDPMIGNIKLLTTFQFLCDTYPVISYDFIYDRKESLPSAVFDEAMSRIKVTTAQLLQIAGRVSTDDARFHTAFVRKKEMGSLRATSPGFASYSKKVGK